MDIRTHTLSGMAAGVTIASLSKSSAKAKTAIILAGAFGGFLPDVDAISLWSHFDGTIGKFFNLSSKGSIIYSSKFWYSHHGFMHSICAGVLFAALIAFFIFALRCVFGIGKALFIACASFFAGYIIHLLEDMPTPGSAWGGVRLFFPSDKYIGGFGKIWWWNNYDIFLIVLSVLLINMTLIVVGRFIKNKFIKLAPLAVFVLGAIAIIIQINSRNYDFSYSGYTNKYQAYEEKSKEIQKNILGERLYSVMKKFDDKLKFYF